MSQALIDTAKASIIAYNDKNWEAARAAMAPGFVYDEVATHRKLTGADNVLPVWKAWAAAFPDSKATFHNAFASGNTVVVELSWRGTHTGPLQVATGTIPATGRAIDMRAVQIVEVAEGKTRSVRQYFDMATMMQQLGIVTTAA